MKIRNYFLATFIIISYNGECQKISSFSDFIDSITFQNKIESMGQVSEDKQFQRWQSIMESRWGGGSDFREYYSAISNYYIRNEQAKSGAKNMGNIIWSYFGPKGIPLHQGTYGSKGSTGKGWVYSLCIDENDTDEILAGSHSSGLWTTSNHGNTWAPLTDFKSEIIGINSIVRYGNTIIISSHFDGSYYAYSKGLFKSTNGGSTWNSINNGDLDGLYETYGYHNLPRKLYKNPYNENELYYLTFSALYRSTNFGSWDEIYYAYSEWGENSFGNYDFEIVEDASNNEYRYISGSKILKSTNGGAFIDITGNVTNAAGIGSQSSIERAEMATNVIYNDKVWFFFKYSGRCYIVKYDGTNYSYLFDYAQTDYQAGKNKMECEISPNDEDVLYLGGYKISSFDEATSNFTSSISDIGLADNNLIYGGSKWIHADIRDLIVIDNSGVDRLYAAHDGGISWGEYDSSLGEFNFHHIGDDGTDGLYISEFNGIDVADDEETIIIGGCQDLSVFVYGAPGYSNQWIHSAAGDAGNCVIDYDDSNYMYSMDYYNKRLNYSENGGIDFLLTSIAQERKAAIVLDPSDPDILYVGATGKLIRYNDARNDLTDRTEFIPTNIGTKTVTAIEIDPNNSDVIYICTNGKNIDDTNLAWKTTNGGTTWSSFSEYTGAYSTAYAVDIEVNPNNSNEVWIAFAYALNGQEKVFHSTNGGYMWTALSENYPNNIPAQRLIFDPVSELLYVATDVGIFYYDETLFNGSPIGWTELGTGLPHKIVTDMEINSVTKKLYVSMYGRGIWVTDLPEYDCYTEYENVVISSNMTWDLDNTFCGDITLSNNSTVTISADIYQSRLSTFIVESGSKLKIDSGQLKSGHVIIESGGELELINGGEIVLLKDEIEMKSGSVFSGDYGNITAE